MKKTSLLPPLLMPACACLLILHDAPSSLCAADLFWNGANNSASPAAGGTGNWNTANNWRSGTATGSQATWSNIDNATLAGTAGTVTINSTSVTASAVTINTGGYVITSTANSRSLTASSLVLGSDVGVEFNLASSSGTWALGGITFGSGASLTLSGSATVGNANRLNLNTASATISGGAITLAGTGTGITGLVATASGVTLNSSITNNSASLTMIGATSGNSLTVGGVVGGSSGVRFSAGDNGGAGTVTISAAGEYIGDTQFNGSASGAVRLGVANGLSTASNVIMGFTSGQGQTFDLNGFDQNVASLTSNAGGTGKITNAAAGSGTSTLTINGAATSGSFGLVIEDGATRKTALVRDGAGTTTLTAANTYTGGTTVNGGTLQIGVLGNGKTGTGNVTVNGATAVLAGSGLVDGNTTSITLGTIKPGDNGGASTGTLNTKTLVFTPVVSTTVLEMQILSNAAFDVLNINGDITLNSNSNILVDGSGYSATIGDTFTILDWSGLLSTGGFSTGDTLRTGANSAGNEGNLDLPDITGIGLWDISGFAGDGALTLTVVAVPEPSRSLFILFGATLVLARRQRGNFARRG